MKPCVPSRAALVLLSLAAFVAASPVAAQGKDDLWEVSSKMEMPSVAMPAQVNRVCLGKNRKDEDLVPKQGDCRMVDSKRAGNKFTYRMQCSSPEPMVIEGEIVFGTNAYDGRMRMTMTKSNGTMNMALAGRRVGDCTAPAR